MRVSARTIAARRIQGFQETVFAKYSRLALEYDAVNLGQGFPDFAPPTFVLDAYRRAAESNQQYPPLPGLPALNRVLAGIYAGTLERQLDPIGNVQITVGATEALFAAMQALIDPGDEVILLEPFYDAYPAALTMAGGTPRYLPLLPQSDGRWHLDPGELENIWTDRTKAIVLNTPHNPTGKVFSAEELDNIVRLAHDYDSIIISDEVYEHISFEPHLAPASRPGGWERTLSISSLGKTFSVTGWKIGWAVGPEPLIEPLRAAHQWIPFTVAGPLQAASADILSQADDPTTTYYQDLVASYRHKRDLLSEALRPSPFKPLQVDGSYFLMADTSSLAYENDVSLAEVLPVKAGVVAIPPSAFYSEPHRHLAKHLLRFAFCKTDEALLTAAQRLQDFG